MTTAVEGGEWSAARPGRSLPLERPGTHCTGGWVGPRTGVDGRKISPHQVSIPDRLARSQFTQCNVVEICRRLEAT